MNNNELLNSTVVKIHCWNLTAVNTYIAAGFQHNGRWSDPLCSRENYYLVSNNTCDQDIECDTELLFSNLFNNDELCSFID